MTILFSSLKWTLLVLVVGGLVFAMTSEAVRIFRAHRNTQGTVIQGYALYEKALPMAHGWRNTLGWEFVDSYHHKFECEFIRYRKQGNWADKRMRMLETHAGQKPVWQADELPIVRYQCKEIPIFYQPGLGWGLF